MKQAKIKTLNITYKPSVTITLEKFGKNKFHYYAEYSNGKTTSSKIFPTKKQAFESYEKYCDGVMFSDIQGLIHLGNKMKLI